jgi:sulfatase modifying factor 1
VTWARRPAVALLLSLSLQGAGCRCDRADAEHDDAAASESVSPAAPSATTSPPRTLYLPDGGDIVQNEGHLEPAPQLLPGQPALVDGGCPPEMVSIRGQFCIDRYEATVVDARERPLSPYYPPSHDALLRVLSAFRGTTPPARQAPPLPLPPEYSLDASFEPRARSLPGVVPAGYMSGNMARSVCQNAGKRLCTPEEWVTACKGQRATQFPYGDRYADGVCNVFRASHPAVLLYGDASKNHLDPRLNLMQDALGPLLRKTGATPACRSDWGQDAVFDMVGNVDEWVDEPTGAFQGGFYARSTRDGCEARITVHPPEYLDYSLGVRCCR